MQLSLKRCKQCAAVLFSSDPFHDAFLSSFELGGEKKTKGAALTFVSHLSFSFMLLASNSLSVSSKFTFHCFYVASLFLYYKYDMQSYVSASCQCPLPESNSNGPLNLNVP